MYIGLVFLSELNPYHTGTVWLALWVYGGMTECPLCPCQIECGCWHSVGLWWNDWVSIVSMPDTVWLLAHCDWHCVLLVEWVSTVSIPDTVCLLAQCDWHCGSLVEWLSVHCVHARYSVAVGTVWLALWVIGRMTECPLCPCQIQCAC